MGVEGLRMLRHARMGGAYEIKIQLCEFLARENKDSYTAFSSSCDLGIRAKGPSSTPSCPSELPFELDALPSSSPLQPNNKLNASPSELSRSMMFG